jgi:type I restriction enzyme S subunit
MIYNEILKREIPVGWNVKPLFDAMSVQYGFPFSTQQFTTEVTDVPVVRIRDILANTISLYTTERVDIKYRLKPNDLVVGMDGNFHINFWDKEGSYLNQRSVRIRARDDCSIASFQAYFELSPYIKAREKNVSRTTVGHLSDKDLKRLHLLEPITSKEFNPRNTFDSLLTKIVHSRVENQELTQLRDWLLPMLMNGQVTVG